MSWTFSNFVLSFKEKTYGTEDIHINFTKFGSLIQLADFFSTEEICKAAIAQQRWGDGKAVCPYCGHTHTYVCSDGRYSYPNCHKKFSVTVGTIFENTKISLRKWFMAYLHLSLRSDGKQKIVYRGKPTLQGYH